MRTEIEEHPWLGTIEVTYFDDGEECSRAWWSKCPHCGGRMRCFRLSDNTGGGDTCMEDHCGYQNLW